MAKRAKISGITLRIFKAFVFELFPESLNINDLVPDEDDGAVTENDAKLIAASKTSYMKKKEAWKLLKGKQKEKPAQCHLKK